MKCYEFDAFLADYFEDDLGPEKTEELLRHLETCESCRAEFQSYKTQEDRLSLYYRGQFDKAVARFESALREEPKAAEIRSTRGSRLTRGLLAAAAVLVAGLGIGTWAIYLRVVPRGHAGVAVVKAAEGRVQALEGNVFQPVVVGSPIEQSQRIKVANGGYLALGLREGNVLEARGGTQLTLQGFPNRFEVVLNGGQIWAHLTRRPEKRFVVRTTHLTATAVGTVFGVEQGLDRSEVDVAKGTVLVESGGTQTTVAEGGRYSSRPEADMAPLSDAVRWSRYRENLSALIAKMGAGRSPDSAPPLQTAQIGQTGTGESGLPRGASSPLAAEPAGSQTALPTAATPSSAITDLIDMLPDETRYFLDVHDWPSLLKGFHSSDYSAVRNEPSVRAWWEAVRGQGFLQEFFSQAHMSEIMALAGLIDGQVVMSVGPAGEFLLVADCGSHEKELNDALRSLLRGIVGVTPTDPRPAREFESRVFVILGRLIVSSSDKLAKATVDRLLTGNPTQFAASEFRRKIMSNVNHPPFVMAADLGSVAADLLTSGSLRSTGNTTEFLGVRGLDYLLLSPSFIGRGMNQAARLGFNGDRYGMMSWLDEPAPMRGLGFFSSDVHFFASAIVRDPSEILLQWLVLLQGADAKKEYARVSEFAAEYQDLLGAFGGEIAVGVDNPILPVPNIKIAIEVADRKTFEAGLERLIGDMRQDWDKRSQASYMKHETYKDYVINTLSVDGVPFAPCYAFVDDYLIAGPGPQFVRNSIDVYTSRNSIARDARLMSLLPGKSEANFSILVYQDIAKAIPELVRTKLTPKIGEREEVLKMIPDIGFLERYRAPGIAYACAHRTYVDFYLSTPKGVDFNVAMAAPLVANWLLPQVSIGLTARKYAEAQQRLEEMKVAVEKYQQENGRLPRSLTDLLHPAGRYLERIPEDPFGVMAGDTLRLVYARDKDQVTIYSIGPDGVDNQGAVVYEFEKDPNGEGDIVIRIPPDSAELKMMNAE